jgi:ketosteroid isomerase-like protein
MTMFNRKSTTGSNRRSFLQTLGVGVSTALGSAAVTAKPDSKTHDLAWQVSKLEAEQALRVVHQQYEAAMDTAQFDAVPDMFTDDAEVVFNGGIFAGREHGLDRLYRQHFAAVKAGKRMPQAPGFELSAAQLQTQLTVASDLQTATAVLPYSIQVGHPLESLTSLASMARSQGEGVHTWWEGGVYQVSYKRSAAGEWKIARLAYHTLARADYRAGKSCAAPINVPAFTQCFPQAPAGPDRLV